MSKGAKCDIPFTTVRRSEKQFRLMLSPKFWDTNRNLVFYPLPKRKKKNTSKRK